MKIESPLGTTETPNQNLRVFDIPDADPAQQELSAMDNEVAKMFALTKEDLERSEFVQQVPIDVNRINASGAAIKDLNQGQAPKQAQVPPQQPPTPQFVFNQPLMNPKKSGLPVYEEQEVRRNRLKAFLGMSVEQTVLEICGIDLCVKTLYGYEQRQVFTIYDGHGGNIIDLQVQMLARAIVSIDDVPFSTIAGGNDFDVKAAFLYKFNQVIVDSFYKSYTQWLEKIRNKHIGNQSLADFMKEMTEEIKKA